MSGCTPLLRAEAVCKVRAMHVAGEPRRLSLEVRFDRRPIEGRLYAEQGELVRPFSGWIGLMAAIQAVGGETLDGEGDSAWLEPRCPPRP